jgi:hypothetical protein
MTKMTLTMPIPGGPDDFLLRKNWVNGMPPTKDKPLTFSYSFLQCYDDVCPYQAYRTYIVRDVPYVETPERKIGNAGHEALALRIGGKPLPADLHHLEPFVAPFDNRSAKAEGKVAITQQGRPTGYFDKDVWLRGAIDVSVVKDTTGAIFDWKFVKQTRYSKRFELDVHAVLLHARYPHLKTITARYVFINQKELSDPYDCSDTAATWQRINEIVKRIEFDLANRSFEKRKGPLCSWCSVYDCERNTNTEHR